MAKHGRYRRIRTISKDIRDASIKAITASAVAWADQIIKEQIGQPNPHYASFKDIVEYFGPVNIRTWLES